MSSFSRKCAVWTLARARMTLQHMIIKRWQSWKMVVAQERETERLAALVTIQTLGRVLIAKRVRAEYRVQYAATQLQAAWRGFYCRKMFRRRAQYWRYTHATCAIQRCFRAHMFRCAFQRLLQLHRAARIVTRTMRRYCAKRKLERAWLRRLARFHAAIAIQIWLRYCIARIRRARARATMVGSAAAVMQRFFKRTRFLLLFDKRVHVLLQKKTWAAQTLQTAYRAKLARVKFHALRDALDAQRRDAALRAMWANAYATSIQTWWRRVWRERRSRALGALQAMSDSKDGNDSVDEDDSGEYVIDMTADSAE